MLRFRIESLPENMSIFFNILKLKSRSNGRSNDCRSLLSIIVAAGFALSFFASLPANAQQALCSVVVGTYGATDSTGWTSITPCTANDPPGASNIIYVSASIGSDTSNCGTLNGPCKTINYAWQTNTTGTLGVGMRNGHPDWLLLKKGDNFSGQTIGYASGGSTGAFPFSGYSAQAPAVISSYLPTGVTSSNPRGTGTGPRPIVNTLTKAYIQAGYPMTFGSIPGWNNLDYFAVMGINFYSIPNDPGSNLITPGTNPSYNSTYPNLTCMYFSAPTNWFLIEDNQFSFFAAAIITQGAQSVSITGAISGNTLTVTTVPSGFTGLVPVNSYNNNGQFDVQLRSGSTYYGTIIAQVSGTPGGVGTYTLDTSSASTGTQTFTAADSGAIHSIIHKNVTVRRNILAYQYGSPANWGAPQQFSTGMDFNSVGTLLLEENVFYNNGWYNGTIGNERNMYNHGAYIQANDNSFSVGSTTNVTTRGNIVMRSSAYGLWQRPGGLSDNNFFYQNGEAQGFGYGIVPINPTNIIQNNVILNSQGNDSSGNNPWGVAIYPTAYPVTVSNNLLAHSEGTNNYLGIGIGTQQEASNYPVNHNVTIQNNVLVDWPTQNNTSSTSLGVGVGPTGAYNNIYDWSSGQVNTVSGNTQFTGNTLSGLGYPDASRTLASYDSTIGGPGTVADFSSKVLSQSKDTWNTVLMAQSVNDYFRAGFGLAMAGASPSTPPTTPPPATPTGLSGAAVSTSQINLSWGTSSGSTGYYVFRNGTNLGATTNTSYQDAGLPSGTTYSYSVSAYNSAGSSPQTAPLSIPTLTAVAAAVPPSVAFTSPANGTAYKGNAAVNIAVNATDSNSKLASITISGDNRTLATCSNATSCSATWQGKKISRGTHIISATAVDALGYSATTSVTITELR